MIKIICSMEPISSHILNDFIGEFSNFRVDIESKLMKWINMDVFSLGKIGLERQGKANFYSISDSDEVDLGVSKTLWEKIAQSTLNPKLRYISIGEAVILSTMNNLGLNIQEIVETYFREILYRNEQKIDDLAIWGRCYNNENRCALIKTRINQTHKFSFGKTVIDLSGNKAPKHPRPLNINGFSDFQQNSFKSMASNGSSDSFFYFPTGLLHGNPDPTLNYNNLVIIQSCSDITAWNKSSHRKSFISSINFNSMISNCHMGSIKLNQKITFSNCVYSDFINNLRNKFSDYQWYGNRKRFFFFLHSILCTHKVIFSVPETA
jgi:hypothetical protein